MSTTSMALGPMIILLFLAFAVAGLVLLVMGWRGRPQLSEPHCAKCGL